MTLKILCLLLIVIVAFTGPGADNLLKNGVKIIEQHHSFETSQAYPHIECVMD